MLMRDDREVRSFRIKSSILRFLVFLFLFLLTAGGAGIWVGVHYWKRIAVLLPQYEENERILAETRVELMELRSFKAVFMAQNNGTSHQAQNDEVGVADSALSVNSPGNATLPSSGLDASALASSSAALPAANATPVLTPTEADAAPAGAFPPSDRATTALPRISD
ncbi:MAG: hypothetical protein LBJ82_00410, partial [Deltaproteobacteria bacterium]|nr:hypothetical protein [Deltaproteobacteria bacterium]